MSEQNLDNETEEKIIQAAREVFLEKGFDGARMQNISERAGINKSLLHYYFRSKDNLFDKIYLESAKKLFPQISEILAEKEIDFMAKIKKFIKFYIEMICQNPLLPIFILREINAGSERVEFIVNSNLGDKLKAFLYEIQAAIDAKIIRPIDPRHLIMSVMSMCIFPFPAKPIFQKQFGMNDAEYFQFLIDRIPSVQDFIINAIKA